MNYSEKFSRWNYCKMNFFQVPLYSKQFSVEPLYSELGCVYSPEWLLAVVWLDAADIVWRGSVEAGHQLPQGRAELRAHGRVSLATASP